MEPNEYPNENSLNENNHLVELGDSDYEIKDGEPDIKGWDVKNELGQKIGEVDDLLFDPESRKVRYIIVDLDDSELELDTDKKVMIPIGIADLYDTNGYEDETIAENEGESYPVESAGDEAANHAYNAEGAVIGTTLTGDEEFETEDDEGVENVDDEDYDGENAAYDPRMDSEVVIVPVTIEQLKELPAYNKENISPETESGIRRIFNGPDSTDVIVYDRNDFYDHDHFDTQKFYDRGATTDSIVPENQPFGTVKSDEPDGENDLEK